MHDGPPDLSSLTILVFFPWTGLMVNEQTSISQRLFTDLKACESTVTWWPSGFGQSETFSSFF